MKLGKSLIYTAEEFHKLKIIVPKAEAGSMTLIVSTRHEAPTKCKLELILKKNRNKAKQKNTPSKIRLKMVTYKIRTSLFNRTIIIIIKKLLVHKITKMK